MTAMLNVEADPKSIKQTSWRGYLLRFGFGGAITVIAGLIAQRFGPEVGGLFLAFPAILPASLTLVEKHDGRRASGASALGAAFGSLGLLAFGLVVWQLAERWPAWQVLLVATLAWLLVSIGTWAIYRTLRITSKQVESRPPAEQHQLQSGRSNDLSNVA
jgi:MFS family permease